MAGLPRGHRRRRVPDPAQRRREAARRGAGSGSAERWPQRERPLAGERTWADLDAAGPDRGAHALAHGDLGPDHWLVAEDGDLVGVLDWTDATWSTVNAEWTPLAIWFGADMLALVLHAYAHGDPDHVTAWALARAPAHVLCWLSKTTRWTTEAPRTWMSRVAPRYLGLLSATAP